MAENPASWKTAELLISEALDDFAAAAPRPGASRVKVIADRLRQAGVIQDADEPEIGWDKLREYYDEQDSKRALEGRTGEYRG
jgi:hypothetical protein